MRRACRFKSCHPYQSIKNEPHWFVFFFLGKNNRTWGNRRLPTNYVCNLHCVQLTRLVHCTSIAITLTYSLQVLSSVPTVRCKLLHRIFRFTKSQLCCAVGRLVRCARFSQMLRAWFSLCLRSSVPSVMVCKFFLIDNHFSSVPMIEKRHITC